MAAPNESQIIEKALQPAEYETDGEKIKQRSAEDLIAILQYAKKSRISTRRAFGVLGIAQLSTPGDNN